MAFDKLSDRVRQLIGENDQRAAANLLLQALRDKNPQLFNIALVQQANIKQLADQRATGILSPDEQHREQAKINVALLHLSDEHARLYEHTAPVSAMPRKALLAAAGLLALLLIGWAVKKTASPPTLSATFDLVVVLHEPGGEERVVREGQVTLRLGEHLLQQRLALDAAGTATFRDLNGIHRGDSAHLLYFPPKDRPFRISRQSAATLTGQDQTIRFTLEYLPETTVYEATLRDIKGRPVFGAQITVDGNLHATSNEHGYFQIVIPKPSGALANFVIEKNGQRLFEQDMMISPGHKPFPI